MLTLLHKSSNAQGTSSHLFLKERWPQEEECNPLPTQHLLFAVSEDTLCHSVLPVRLSKHRNLSSLHVSFLEKRFSRFRWENQILLSLCCSYSPSCFQSTVTGEPKVCILERGRISSQLLCVCRLWCSAVTEGTGVIMCSLLETQQIVESFSMGNDTLKI